MRRPNHSPGLRKKKRQRNRKRAERKLRKKRFLALFPFYLTLKDFEKQSRFTNDACISRICPKLFLGSEEAAESKEVLQAHNIKAIVCIKAMRRDKPTRQMHESLGIMPENYLFLFVPMVSPSFPIDECLVASYDFIRTQHEQGRCVLVHCAQGKHRSAAHVQYYVERFLLENDPEAQHESIRLHDRVYLGIQKQRPCANPPSFYLDSVKQAVAKVRKGLSDCQSTSDRDKDILL